MILSILLFDAPACSTCFLSTYFYYISNIISSFISFLIHLKKSYIINYTSRNSFRLNLISRTSGARFLIPATSLYGNVFYIFTNALYYKHSISTTDIYIFRKTSKSFVFPHTPSATQNILPQKPESPLFMRLPGSPFTIRTRRVLRCS